MSFNTAKIINVYYKADRKPYDVNGKPISYFGEDFVGSNEATEVRFYMPNNEDLGAVECAVDVKRPNGDKRYDLLTKVTGDGSTYYKLELNDWYSSFVGKVTIAFKAYKGGIVVEDGVITSVTAPVYVSDIFHLQIAYAPNSTEAAPAFDPSDVTTFLAALSAKLNVNNGIFVIASALPTLTGGVYNGQWFLVKNNADGSLGKLFYINGSTAEEVELGLETLKLTPTGNGDITTNTGKLTWQQPNGTAQLGLYNDVNVGIGEDVFYYGKASATITKGQAIQFGGYQGDHILIKPAVPSEINANPKLIMGIAKHAIANGDFGYVLAFGKLDKFDSGSFPVGSLLWFNSASGSNGLLTATQPTAPNAKILMAAVIKVTTGGGQPNGVIQVRINIEPKLGELQDVNIASVADKNVLRYSSANARWENVADLTTAETDISNIEDGTTIVGKANADKDGNEFDATYLKKSSASATYVPLSSKGVANGVAPLDSSNKIPSIHLPGGVDDIKEFANLGAFPATGEASIIYVALDTNKIYRWSGSAYTEISSSLALGTTSSTAFAGDRGLATETKTNNIVSGVQGLTDTRITNSAVGVVPVIVNGIASTTANLQQWQVNGSNVARIDSDGGFGTSVIRNLASTNNSYITLFSTGTTIVRNIADANPSLIVNQANASSTGNIANFQFGGANKLEVTKDGFLNQNGTRLFNQIAGDTNTFFGNLSGGTATTGTLNTGIGKSSLTSLTSGAGNTAVGRNSLTSVQTGSSNTAVGVNALSVTTGGSNTAIGNEAGTSLQFGSNNTFIGTSAGNNASQLVTASNSTGIGYQAYTDASNQMVFGNASVTQFKFDRNASATALLPITQISGATFPPLLTQRTSTSGTNSLFGVSQIKMTTTQDMVDGYGGSLVFSIQDSANTDNLIGEFGAIRSGADNSGRLVFRTATTGTITEKMTIMPDGKVGIGTTSPITNLQVNTSSNSTFSILAQRVSIGTNDHAGIGFKISDNLGVGTVKGSITFSRQASSGRGSLLFLTNDVADGSDVSTSDERMRITSAGLVGINETTISAQLQVKSGAVDRVPLIVDTIASNTQDLQYWRVNGSLRAFLLNNGNFGTPQVQSNSGVDNSRIALASTGTTISRNVNTSDPALIVNKVQGTGNIQVWQFANNAVSHIDVNGNFVSAFTERTQILTTDQNSTDDQSWTTAFTSPTLDANAYYEVELVGVHSKTSTSTSTRLTIGFILNNISGSPTFTSNGDGWSSTVASSVSSFAIDTTQITNSSFGLYTATAGSFGIRPFSVRGVLFTGDSTKTISTQHRNSATITSGSVTLAKGTYIKYRRIA